MAVISVKLNGWTIPSHQVEWLLTEFGGCCKTEMGNLHAIWCYWAVSLIILDHWLARVNGSWGTTTLWGGRFPTIPVVMYRQLQCVVLKCFEEMYTITSDLLCFTKSSVVLNLVSNTVYIA